MEETILVIKIVLVVFFFLAVSYSYIEYDERREPIDRFSSAISFLDALKNNVLCIRIAETPNPGLVDLSKLKEFKYKNLSRYWAKPHHWEVFIKDSNGVVLYREGDLTRRGLNYTWLVSTKYDYSVAHAPVAIRGEDGANRFGSMEVLVWSS